jgi:hypothetical protein
MLKFTQLTTLFFTRRRTVLAAAALLSLTSLMTAKAFGQGGSNNGCPVGTATTISGKVYSPNGLDPLPNILVYVPTTPVLALPTGVSDCTAASQLVSGTPLVSTTTAADGSFSLTSPGLAGTQTIVIQAGKWRRQYPGVVVTSCQTNVAPTLQMPQNQSQGDIPHIAISTGASDALECVIRKIGISDSEFTAPAGAGRISLYAGSEAPGILKDAAGTTLPSEATLVSSQAALNAYDLAMFACQGTPTNPAAAAIANQNNVVAFGDAGGRVFATHYSYVWLDNSTVWAGTANWALNLADETISSSTTVPINATIDQTYPEGVVLANWLYDIGATPTKGQLPLYVTKKDQTGVNPPTQSWATLNSPADGNPVMQFTFDTPLKATTTPTVTLNFVNSPNTYDPLAGQTAGNVAISVVNNSGTAADNSLNLSITLPTGFTATSLAGTNAGTGWVCSPVTLTCNRTTGLAAGATDNLTLGLNVSTNAQLGQQQVSVTVAGGGLSGTNQCGRVLFNEYHVETVSTGSKAFPSECTAAAMSPQEKFLEFSLYNLSNFVAPVTSDMIDVVAMPTTTWATPASIYYGTPLGATQLDATASAPGTFAYTPPAGTILPVGIDTLNAVFNPTDTTSYTTANASTTITVLQDTTQTMLTATPNPATLGSPVTLTATVVGNAAAPTGTVTFYSGTTAIGTGTLTATTGDAAVATLTTSSLPLGNSILTATYGATTNFGASTSAKLTEVVQGTSSVTITGLVTPIDYGQIIGDTAQIIVSGSSTGGTTTVYINNIAVCTLPVAPGMTTTCPASTGANYPIGTYTIYAVFSGDPLYMGSTSPTYTVQIVPDPTTTTLVSSLNPSRLGNSVTFTATVAAPYATATGNVTFADGSTQLGVGALNSVGMATYSTTALTVGTHNITASYAATTNFNASATTNALAQVVLPPLPLGGAPGYILTVTPTTLNALVGAANPIAVTIQEVNGYSEPVALTCTGLTNEATCTFEPSTVAAGGGTATLYLTPAAPHACGSNVPFFVASNGMRNVAEGGLGLASLLVLLGFTTRRRRKLLQAALLVLALCAMPLLNGCGTVGCTDLGTKPGTYSFTVQAAPTTGPSGQYEGVQSQTVTYTATL